MKTIKNKNLPIIDVSTPIWYLERSARKSSAVTSSALSLIMTSMLPLFECIVRSLSLPLEELKLITIVNWTFQVSDFLR